MAVCIGHGDVDEHHIHVDLNRAGGALGFGGRQRSANLGAGCLIKRNYGDKENMESASACLAHGRSATPRPKRIADGTSTAGIVSLDVCPARWDYRLERPITRGLGRPSLARS